MKRSVITGFFLLLSVLGFPQGEFNNWYFGGRAGVSFNSGFPVAFTYGQCLGTGSTTSVSDALGNTLFYSNGFEVYNRNNVQMPNGYISGFQCSTNYYQINLAVKQINKQQKYYLFTTACWHPADPGVFRYSVIDMTLDGGNGDIPPSMNGIHIPGGYRAYHSVTGTRHQNNHDAWVVVRLQDTDSNYFYSYLVNSSGINFFPVVSNSLVNLFTPLNMVLEIRNMRISRDGSKMVVNYDTISEFCQFNDVSGHVDPLFTFCLPKIGINFLRPATSEFSLDANLLYMTGYNNSNNIVLYQFDATKTDSAQFVQSAVFLDSSGCQALALQMAPDWKIYATSHCNDTLSLIKYPSVPGTGCIFQPNVISLDGRLGGEGFPQFIEEYFAIIHETGHCQYQPVHFNPEIWPPADSIHWDFGDPGSGIYNFSNIQNATHI